VVYLDGNSLCRGGEEEIWKNERREQEQVGSGLFCGADLDDNDEERERGGREGRGRVRGGGGGSVYGREGERGGRVGRTDECKNAGAGSLTVK